MSTLNWKDNSGTVHTIELTSQQNTHPSLAVKNDGGVEYAALREKSLSYGDLCVKVNDITYVVSEPKKVYNGIITFEKYNNYTRVHTGNDKDKDYSVYGYSYFGSLKNSDNEYFDGSINIYANYGRDNNTSLVYSNDTHQTTSNFSKTYYINGQIYVIKYITNTTITGRITIYNNSGEQISKIEFGDNNSCSVENYMENTKITNLSSNGLSSEINLDLGDYTVTKTITFDIEVN